MARNLGTGVPRRLLTAAAIAACGLFLSSVGAAADSIGQTQDGSTCNGGAGMDTVQVASAGSSYAVPAGAWQITDWSAVASGSQDGTVALEVWSATATAGTYQLVAISPAQALTAGSGPSSFHLDAPIAVQGGDLLGLRVTGAAGCDFTLNFAGDGFAEALNTPTPAAGDAVAFPFTMHGFELSVAATLAAAAPPPPPTPEDRTDCKDGGWQQLTDATGTPFKNEGDCVSYVSTQGRNTAG